MKLLVSVSNADEASEAVEGGADIIDAKDPSRGALGPVLPEALSEIRGILDPNCFLTAAIGDACDGGVEELARDLVARGAMLVKLGFAGVDDDARVEKTIARVARACSSADERSGVVAVAYADAGAGWGINAHRLVRIAARSGARAVLVDTADKRGPGLMGLWNPADLASWIEEVHAHELIAAVAGKLTCEDLEVVRVAGADVAGVRGAACVGGRTGRVSAERVRALAMTYSRRFAQDDTAPAGTIA